MDDSDYDNPADFQGAVNQRSTLHEIWIKNSNRLIICNWNVNSLRNKFVLLEELIKDKTDIFLITKTKLDSSFPSRQFVIKGYSTPFRLNRNQNGGGLFLYVRKNIPCNNLKEYTSGKPNENRFVEISLRSRKWLLSCSYIPQTNLRADQLHCIGRGIDFYSSNYYNFFVLGDLNTGF